MLPLVKTYTEGFDTPPHITAPWLRGEGILVMSVADHVAQLSELEAQVRVLESKLQQMQEDLTT